MIAESLVDARSFLRTPRAFRRYLVDAVGLWSRGERQLRAWTPHINRTLAVIDTTIDDIAPRRTVAVLGAGPLFDVPLEALARPGTPKRAAAACVLSDLPGLDWVISVNLLSQISRAAAEGNERQVIDRHLAGLAALPMPVTLVIDIDYRVFDRAGTLLDEFDLMHGRILPRPSDRWLWEVAPFGEEAPDTRRVHSVLAYPDWHAACKARSDQSSGGRSGRLGSLVLIV